MAVKYGPTRGELKFRLAFSLAGLGLMIFALVYRGVPTGPAFVEVVGIAGLFFGGTAIWSGWRLMKSDRDG
jgi:xanthosine utilization system XapX-like protein